MEKLNKDTLANTVGTRLKELRKAMTDLGQKDVAGDLGITKQALSNYESGRNLPDFSAYLPYVLFGKHYIKKHQIRSFVLEGINSLLSVICREHHIAFVFKIKL